MAPPMPVPELKRATPGLPVLSSPIVCDRPPGWALMPLLKGDTEPLLCVGIAVMLSGSFTPV